jgi:hypothetical protein
LPWAFAVTEQCAAKCEYDLTLLSGGVGIYSPIRGE